MVLGLLNYSTKQHFKIPECSIANKAQFAPMCSNSRVVHFTGNTMQLLTSFGNDLHPQPPCTFKDVEPHELLTSMEPCCKIQVIDCICFSLIIPNARCI